MGGRSGERANRLALGLDHGRGGYEVAKERQTLRFSVLEGRKAKLPAILTTPAPKSVAISARKDVGHLCGALAKEVARLNRKSAALKTSIPPKVPGEVEVTDHAVIRFLERVMSIDVNAIRAQIARLVPVEALEPGRMVYIRDGFTYLMSDAAIVTILDDKTDGDIRDHFSIDGVHIAPLKPPVEGDEKPRNIRRAASLLSRRGHAKKRAPINAKSAQLEAEKAAGWPIKVAPR